MTEKREYDAALGGDVVLENHVQTFKYAASALQEIRQLIAETRQTTGTKLVFQTLPKHMRRRAMSHHPKRLPRKYRSIHIAQMEKSGKQRVNKRPSRKHRRRPKNLLADYVRRQRRNVWLETHIWHAKRFHMIERWGYRLAFNSCDKTFRACYRATAEHCLVQDISYFVCLELEGSVEKLFEGFKGLSNQGLSTSNGLSMKAKTFLTGRREGFIDLFRNGKYPEGALCRASFMWRPSEGNSGEMEEEKRTLWLWIHPCVYVVVVEELIRNFELKLVEEETEGKDEKEEEIPESSEKALEIPNKKKKKNQELRLQFMTKNSAHLRVKKYENPITGITLTDLKDTLNRFRLTGPLSQNVLQKAFKSKTLSGEQNPTEDLNWFQQSLKSTENFHLHHKAQEEFWNQCANVTNPSMLLSNMILALNVFDPRLQRPEKRTKSTMINDQKENMKNNFDLLNLLQGMTPDLAKSALWDAKVRQILREKIMDTHKWNQLRAKHSLVPGAPCAFEEDLQPVPVLLIQRPGCRSSQQRLSYGCGWDVIAPAGYGMPIWMTFIMWGAKPGGLRELETLAREMGTEFHLPDTVGGLQKAAERYAEQREKYFRLPPNKRSNYRKLAIASPFKAPWPQLIRDWRTTSEEPITDSSFFILRDSQKLKALELAIRGKVAYPNESEFTLPANGLIQLHFRLKSRGNVTSNGLICLPTNLDMKRHYRRRLRNNFEPVHKEPLLPDLNEKERKTARLEHKKQLKRLRGRRLREKRKLQETSTTRVRIRPANTTSLVAEHFKRMTKLWLPDEDCSTLFSVRKQSSRETFGYITEASFSFIKATVCAVGYVTGAGLLELLKICHKNHVKTPMCLVRDTKSQHYYFATFDLLLS